jgi:hypothetical protein
VAPKSQSEAVREVVEELTRVQHEYEAKQLELRTKLRNLFGVGPATPQRDIVKQVIDLFLFPNL